MVRDDARDAGLGDDIANEIMNWSDDNGVCVPLNKIKDDTYQNLRWMLRCWDPRLQVQRRPDPLCLPVSHFTQPLHLIRTKNVRPVELLKKISIPSLDKLPLQPSLTSAF